MARNDHPNEPGAWTRIDATEGAVLWRRDRLDPVPLTMFYIVAPPRQMEVIYGESQAKARFAALFPRTDTLADMDLGPAV
jgi:hypothetical protein